MERFYAVFESNLYARPGLGEQKWISQIPRSQCLGGCSVILPARAKIPSELVSGFGVNISQAAYEMERLSEAYGKTEGIHLRHMVLSFSPSEIEQLQPDALGEIYKIGTYAAQYYGSEYQIVYSLHEDSGNYHVHFVMNTVSFLTGRKYRGDKADYYRFQDYLKEFLGEYYGMKLYVLSDKESHTRKIPAKPMA